MPALQARDVSHIHSDDSVFTSLAIALEALPEVYSPCEARPLRARSIRLLRLTVGRMYTGRAASLESQQLSLVPPMPRVAVTSSSASSNSSPKQVPLAGPFIPLDVSTAASIEETEPEHQTSVRHTASGSATEHPSPLHRRSSFSRHRAQAAALRAARQRALLHHIQRERGTSLAWIACGGSMPFFFRRLCQNRAGTDAALDTLDDEAIRELIAKRRQVVDAEVRVLTQASEPERHLEERMLTRVQRG
eukprot:scaffold188542_cov30-Tisochrysis_lutea.AAC.4